MAVRKNPLRFSEAGFGVSVFNCGIQKLRIIYQQNLRFLVNYQQKFVAGRGGIKIIHIGDRKSVGRVRSLFRIENVCTVCAKLYLCRLGKAAQQTAIVSFRLLLANHLIGYNIIAFILDSLIASIAADNCPYAKVIKK